MKIEKRYMILEIEKFTSTGAGVITVMVSVSLQPWKREEERVGGGENGKPKK